LAARPTAIHATAVAIERRGLLIVGPSKAGKSRLALALIEISTRRHRIRLIGDDRILLSPTAAGLVARPHPRIAGFIERRGLGIVAMPHAPSAPIVAIVDLGEDAPSTALLAVRALGGAGLPALALAAPRGDAVRRDMVLRWFRGLRATNASQGTPKTPHRRQTGF
jgi:HPr kinase/phosphorylase